MSNIHVYVHRTRDDAGEQKRDEKGQFAAVAATAVKHGYTTKHGKGLVNRRGDFLSAKRETGGWTHEYNPYFPSVGPRVHNKGAGSEELDTHLLGHNKKLEIERKQKGKRFGWSPKGSK